MEIQQITPEYTGFTIKFTRYEMNILIKLADDANAAPDDHLIQIINDILTDADD